MAPRGDPCKVRTFKIHVSNISKDLGQAELRIMFEPFGRIVECEVFKKAYAFIHMEDEECGRVAIKELHNKVIEGKVMAVTASSNTEPPNIATTKLAVRNIPLTVTPQMLRSLFQKFGMVLECEVRLGQGSVSLEATGDIRSAINEINGLEMQGKTLEVEAFKPRKPFPSSGGNPKFGGAPPQFRQSQPRYFDQGRVSRNYCAPTVGGRGRGFRNPNQDNYFEDSYDSYGPPGPPGPQNGFHHGPPNFRNGNGMGMGYQPSNMGYQDYQSPNMGYQQEFQEEFGGGYSMNEDFGEDSYEDNSYEDSGLPDGYFPPQRPVQVRQPPVREVAPGEAYPPPAKVPRITGLGQYGTKPLMKGRGERGGRNRMTTGKVKMVQALTASGVNVPRNYIPNLMNSQTGGPARFIPDEMEESPNMLPVSQVRGFRVPMPQFGGPRPGPGPLMRPRAPMGQGVFGGPRPNPGAFRPVFRNPSNAPGGRLLPPNYQAYRPTRPGSANPMMQTQRMQRPQSVLDIDFSADIDCY